MRRPPTAAPRNSRHQTCWRISVGPKTRVRRDPSGFQLHSRIPPGSPHGLTFTLRSLSHRLHFLTPCPLKQVKLRLSAGRRLVILALSTEPRNGETETWTGSHTGETRWELKTTMDQVVTGVAEPFPLEVQRGQDTCPGSHSGAGAPRSLGTEGRSPRV